MENAVPELRRNTEDGLMITASGIKMKPTGMDVR